MSTQNTFKETIKRSLIDYPTLYTTPGDVVHHLFSVNGNGMEWHNGQLVSRFQTDKQSGLGYLRQCIKEAKEQNMESLVLYYQQILHNYRFFLNNSKRIVDHGEYRYNGSYYELCGYAKIMCVPENDQGHLLVDDDWLKGMYEYASSALVSFRMKKNENHPDFKAYEFLMSKFDAELIRRGLHSTHAEREELMQKMVAKLKKNEI